MFTPSLLKPPVEYSRCQRLQPGPVNELTKTPNLPHEVDKLDTGLRALLRRLVNEQALWPLFLHGSVGSGKTCAALTLLEHYGGWYTKLGYLHELVQDARAGRLHWSGPTADQITVRSLRAAWSEANVTMIDEVGLRSLSDPAYETLYTAIEERERQPLMVISNFSLSELSEQGLCDERIRSRLKCGSEYELTGDRRMEDDKSGAPS